MDAVKTAVANRSLLIVLDNCEHVTEAASGMARELAHASDGVHVMTTSQHELRIPGAVVWKLLPLDVPAGDWPADLLSSDAVRLFRERAGERPRIPLDRHTLDIAKICRLLDGIPLAIELAATLCDAHSIPEILASLERGDRDAHAGHRRWDRASPQLA